MEHRSWGLEGALLHRSTQEMGIFFPLKVRKEGQLEDAIVNATKNGGFEMSLKKWVCSKNDKKYKGLKRFFLGGGGGGDE